jgi:hypothetical protein
MTSDMANRFIEKFRPIFMEESKKFKSGLYGALEQKSEFSFHSSYGFKLYAEIESVNGVDKIFLAAFVSDVNISISYINDSSKSFEENEELDAWLNSLMNTDSDRWFYGFRSSVKFFLEFGLIPEDLMSLMNHEITTGVMDE